MKSLKRQFDFKINFKHRETFFLRNGTKNLDLDAKTGVPHPLSHLVFTSPFKSTSVIMIPTAYHHPTNSGIKNLDLCTVSSGPFLPTFYYPLSPKTLQSQLYSIHHSALRANPINPKSKFLVQKKPIIQKKEKHEFSGVIGPTKLRIRLLLLI